MKRCFECMQWYPNASVTKKHGVCPICKEKFKVYLRQDNATEQVNFNWTPKTEQELFDSWRPNQHSYKQFLKEREAYDLDTVQSNFKKAYQQDK